MKFKRERTPSHWFVKDIYLRDTWGDPYYLSRPRRFNYRRLFILAMVLFGLVDLVLVGVFGLGLLFPPRAPAAAARRPAATRAPTLAALLPTLVARRTTPLPPPTQRPAPKPTQVPPVPPTAAPVEPTAAPAVKVAKAVIPARTIGVQLPATLNVAPLSLVVPPEPPNCTPADQMPDLVTASVKLCGGQSYRPFTLRGDNIGVFGDKTSLIRAEGRAFGITAEGAQLWIQDVVIRATTAPGDASILLCLYPDCRGNPGGVAYGGGILVRASDTTVMNSDIAGGVAGVAAERVTGLTLVNNHLDNSSGWGSYNFDVRASHFVGNSWSNDNRSCTTPDGGYLPTGCESAGWLCIACSGNIIAKNTCTNSGDCYYMNGEGNLKSNDNRFHQNECRAAPHNCYEVTFSTGNEFVENIARADPETGAACKYPFWVGGSHVIFARNVWQCNISPEEALQHATASTFVPTRIDNQ